MEQCGLKLQLFAGAGPQAGQGWDEAKLGKQEVEPPVADSVCSTDLHNTLMLDSA